MPVLIRTGRWCVAIVIAAVLTLATAARSPLAQAPASPSPSLAWLNEATIADLQQHLADGSVTSRAVVEWYLTRIKSLRARAI